MAYSFTEEEIAKLFGSEAAEDEKAERLLAYYFKGSIYDQVIADLNLRIIVGHKGVGKSALFKVAMQEDIDNKRLAIFIRPDDIASLSLNNDDFLQLIREWKTGLLEIIAEKILTEYSRKPGEIKEWLSVYSGKFIDFIKDSIKTHTGLQLDSIKNGIIDTFISTNKIFVYIDDLDRGWQGSKTDIRRISALLNSVRDLCNEFPTLYFRIALRSDVYFLVRTSDESTDKIERAVIWLKWTNHEIFALLVKRIETYNGRNVSEEELCSKNQQELSTYLNGLFVKKYDGDGKWANAPIHRVLMSLIRKRPRDLIKLCSMAARNAQECNFDIIKTENLKAIFEDYSQGRLQDTINEYISELPDIKRLLLQMKPSRKEIENGIIFKYQTDQLYKKIENILGQGKFVFANGEEATVKDIAAFLYKINFLTARKIDDHGKIVRKYFEESRYLSNSFSDFGFNWEIHPAYRWALQPDNIFKIFEDLELSYE